jgi:hypothetical protein
MSGRMRIMSEIHVLVNSHGEPLGAFSDRTLLEEYIELCTCSECVYIWSIIMDNPQTIQQLRAFMAQTRTAIHDELDKLME